MSVASRERLSGKQNAEINERPCEESTDSSQAPKPQHVEGLKPESAAMVGEEEGNGLKRHGWADVEHEPSWQVTECDSPRVVDQAIGMAVEVRDEEFQDDVDGEEPVDDVIEDEEGVFLISKEGELKRADPSRVNHEDDQPHFPRPEPICDSSASVYDKKEREDGISRELDLDRQPVARIVRGYHVLPKLGRMVDSWPEWREEEIAGEVTALVCAIRRPELVYTEPPEEVLGAGERHVGPVKASSSCRKQEFRC